MIMVDQVEENNASTVTVDESLSQERNPEGPSEAFRDFKEAWLPC